MTTHRWTSWVGTVVVVMFLFVLQWGIRDVPGHENGARPQLMEHSPVIELCVFVRTTVKHSPREDAYFNVARLLASLSQQEGIRSWKAFLFITDDSPFDFELASIASAFPQASVIALPQSLRTPYDPSDAGYAATDHVLFNSGLTDSCESLVITNGDNVYGSRSLGPAVRLASLGAIVLIPFESRYVANMNFNDLREESWADRCRGIVSQWAIRDGCAYCVQAFPRLGAVDLGSAVFNGAQFRRSEARFSKYTGHARCQGCQDGEFIEAFAMDGRKVVSLPLDGIESVLHHAPSPSLCIADGGVWVDEPAVSAVRCVARDTVAGMRIKEANRYDWDHFDHTQVCLRLSKMGYDKADPPIRWKPTDAEVKAMRAHGK